MKNKEEKHKMKKTRFLALLLAIVMAAALAAACAPAAGPVELGEPPPPPPVEQQPAAVDTGDAPAQPPPTADITPAAPILDNIWTVAVNLIDADALPGWQNAIGNAHMRILTIKHASPVAFTRTAEFVVNPTVTQNVEGPVVNADNSRTWTITLQPGLRWSDGAPLTARDYVFSYLFWAAPAMSFAGDDPDNPLPNLDNRTWTFSGMREVNGLIEHRTMQSDILTGVRLINDLTFSVTIDAETEGVENFPFFYELTYIDIDPLPMHVFAPGMDVNDNGVGTYVTGPGLTYEFLRATVDDGVSGFRYTMGPTAGPYFLAAAVDMDAEFMVLQRNPYFHGTYDGTFPSIDTIIIRRVDNALLIPSLQQGEIDHVIQAAGGAAINPGLELVAGGGFDYRAMPRNGSGGLFFHWDIGPTQFVEVRRAIAWTLDRVEFNNMWAQGHATTLDTLVGVAQWMYLENRDRIPGLMTFNYTLNLANATAELVNGGWIYNANGGAWQPGDGPRHKRVDGELMPLVLRWASPDANEIGAMLASLMTEPANSIGIYFDHVFVTMADFGPALMGLDSDNRFNMINGGLGIPEVDAVWNTYNPDPAFWGTVNWTRTNDAELHEYALGRRNATNRAEYLQAWMGFIARFNYVLPVLPLNSDIFHDFFRAGLENFEPTSLFTWQWAIVWANIAGHER